MSNQSNTPGVGGEFEVFVPAYFALCLNNNSKVKNFRIRSNASGKFGKLDDVVIDILLDNDERIHFAFQLKKQSRNLAPDSLENDSGKYSLLEYYQSFKKIEQKYHNYYFILYTDANFDKANVRKVRKFEMTEYSSEDSENMFHKIMQEFNTSAESDDANTSAKSDDANTSAISDDANTSAISDDAKTKNIYKFTKNVENKNNGNSKEREAAMATNAQNGADPVKNEDMDAFLSKFFLFVCQKSFGDLKQSILNILQHDGICLKYEELFRNWHRAAFTNKEIDKKTLNAHLVDIFLSSSLIRSYHLPIDEGNTNLELFNTIPRNFDVTVVNSSIEMLEDGLRKLEISHYMSSCTLHRITDKIRNYMVKYEMDLQELHSGPSQAMESCLLRIAKECKFVKKSCLDNHINVQMKILHYFFGEPLILEFNKDSESYIYLMLELYKTNEDRIKFVLLGQDFDNERFPNLSVATNLEQVVPRSELFQEILQRCQLSIQGKDVLLSDLISNNSEIKDWVEVREILQMLKNNYRVGETEIKDLQHVITNIKAKSSNLFRGISKGALKVVCTETGMGKSAMLQHLKNICPSFFWIKGHTFHYYKDISDVSRFLENSLKLLGEGRNIENFFLDRRRVAIFFDELDAVSSNNLNSVLEFIRRLCLQEYIIFVSTRKFLRDKIVNCFGDLVEIVEIEKLSKDEQIAYIRQQILRNGSDMFFDSFSASENTYFGIPLFLISEKLRVKLLEERVPNPVTLCSIYFEVVIQHLVKKIENEGNNEEALVRDSKSGLIFGDIDTMQLDYEFPALEFLFGDEVFDKLNIYDKRSYTGITGFLSRIRKYNDPLGIMSLNADGHIVFEHPSLAEYLAGNYCAFNPGKFELLKQHFPGNDIDNTILGETYFTKLGLEKSSNGCNVALSA